VRLLTVCVVWHVWCGMNDGETARESSHLRSGECQMVVQRGVKAGNKECGLVAGMKRGGRVAGEDQMWAVFQCKGDSSMGSGIGRECVR
jgi:hypothetical protein